MAQPTPLYINGGVPSEEIKCYQCGTPLGNERAVGPTRAGPRFFCKMEPDATTESSCYNQYRRYLN